MKALVPSKRTPVKMICGTDGSAKGADQSPDKKSFSGWGFAASMQYESGRTGRATRYGHMLNATPLEAELVAINEVLKFIDKPTEIEFVVDSASAISWLTSGYDIQGKMDAYLATPAPDKRPRDREEFRVMKIVADIQENLKNPMIRGASISWVRAHGLDELSPTQMPNPKETDNPQDERLVRNMLMNHMADLLANEGARKAVRTGVYGLAQTGEGTPDRQRVVKSLRKNLFYSYFARFEAIDFLSKQSPDFLDDEAIMALFSDEDISAIEEKRYLDDQRLNDHFNDVPLDRRVFLVADAKKRRDLVSGLLKEEDPEPQSPRANRRSKLEASGTPSP